MHAGGHKGRYGRRPSRIHTHQPCPPWASRRKTTALNVARNVVRTVDTRSFPQQLQHHRWSEREINFEESEARGRKVRCKRQKILRGRDQWPPLLPMSAFTAAVPAPFWSPCSRWRSTSMYCGGDGEGEEGEEVGARGCGWSGC